MLRDEADALRTDNPDADVLAAVADVLLVEAHGRATDGAAPLNEVRRVEEAVATIQGDRGTKLNAEAQKLSE